MARDVDVSSIYRRGASPNTRVALSMKNRIFSTPYSVKSPTEKQVGVVATFDQSESRSVDPVRGVGVGDRIIELAPGVTEPLNITLNHTLMYTSSIVQECGYRGGVDGIVRSLRHHKWPFDLRSELVFSELVTNYDRTQITDLALQRGTKLLQTGNYALITYFWACWISSYSVSYSSDSTMVMEDATVVVTDVTDGSSNYGDLPDTYGDSIDAGNSPLLQAGAGSKIFG